ncbi:MAG: YbeD family protein [Gammaproteobacteria bacterium]
MITRNEDTLLEFPCIFPIKIMGHHHDTFEEMALNIIIKHLKSELNENAIQTRPSKNGKYLALTVTIEAHSKQQLDTIYQELTACEHVLMAL